MKTDGCQLDKMEHIRCIEVAGCSMMVGQGAP